MSDSRSVYPTYGCLYCAFIYTIFKLSNILFAVVTILPVSSINNKNNIEKLKANSDLMNNNVSKILLY